MSNEATYKTICLCCIVKDESKVIGRLIESCKGLIDYWVIIDTGSKDNTIEIIKKGLKDIPGELFESKWVNFGHNRSELMKKAKDKADYFLLMDADMEIVVEKDFDRNKLTHNAYHLRYTGDIDFAQMLFVNGHLDWEYIGVTHEYIKAKNIGKAPVLDTLKVIHHCDGGHRPEKIDRDIRLLEQAIVDEPDNPRNFFYLAQTYANKPDIDKAIEYYTKRAQMGGWEEEVFYCLFQIGLMLHKKKDYNSAIHQLHEAYCYRPSRFEPLCELGIIFREQKKYQLARIYFEEASRIPYPEKDLLFIHKAHKEYLIDFELAICYYWIGNYKMAMKHALVVQFKEGVPDVIKNQNEENMKFIDVKLKVLREGLNDIIFCSMFTIDTPYEQEVKILQASMDRFNLPYEIIGVNSKGEWAKNTQMKPSVIKAVMEKYNKDVVWLDADAVIEKDPVFFKEIKGDLSYHYIKQWDEMLTGTLFIRNNEKMRGFLDQWYELNQSNNNPDAVNFQTLVTKRKQELDIEDLPADYIKIFDNPLIESNDPVITHNQASRRFKNKVSVPKAVESSIIKQELSKLVNGHISCAVIGNGPFKTDLSKEIEKAFVMRCNNFKTGYKEIGDKVDLNISSLYYEIIPDKKVDYPVFGILPISDRMYQQYTDAKQMHKYWLENGQKLIDMGITTWMYGDNDSFAKVFKEVAKEINAFPTVGMMGIALARWMGFKNIILSGFTFFQTEKSHYWTNEKVNPSIHHNPEAEKELLNKWIKNDNIEYVLDEVMKLNLKYHAST